MTFLDQGEYSTGFFSCCADVPICAFSCCCPCIASGRLVGRMSDDEFSIPACLCPMIGIYRARRTIQTLHVRKESEDASTLAAALPWINLCALCQDYREWEHFSDSSASGGSRAGRAAAPEAVDAPTTAN